MQPFSNLFRPAPVVSMLQGLDALDQSILEKSPQWANLKRKAVLRILHDEAEICFEVEVGQVQVMNLLLNLLGNTCFHGLVNLERLMPSAQRLQTLQEGVMLYKDIIARSLDFGFMSKHEAGESIHMLMKTLE